MNASIESIWRNGFIDERALVAPRINDLYVRKSSDIVDRLVRMGRINQISVVVAAVAVLAFSALFGSAYTGAVFAGLLVLVAAYGRSHLSKIRELDKGADCYHYLKAFDALLKTAIAGYTRLYRLMYPTFLLAGVHIVWNAAGFGERWAEALPDSRFYLGVPAPILAGSLVAAALIGVFAGPLFRLDLRLVYGRAFDKLEELLADMEELRTSDAATH